jgi:tetratricopeptide (TPR) repeat protein
MRDSSYAQPLPPSWAARTASGTRADGASVRGRWHVYPEMAAAGLWTTATDLTRFAIEIALSGQGKANHLLSTALTREMLTPVIDGAALGFFVSKETPGEFGHGGADEGFQALLTMNGETGKGLAVMANSDRGLAVAGLVQQAVAREYGWKRKQGGDTFATLLLLAKARGAARALRRCTEMQATGAVVDEGLINQLGYVLLGDGQTADAILVFERNVADHPGSSNAHDSLGEAYLKAGRKELAIARYRRSLALDPANQNAAAVLKTLQAED